MSIAFVGLSLPTFVTGPIFLSRLAFRLGWFPVGGYGFDLWSHVYHAVLPAFVLAIVGAATYARLMRSEMIETLGEDYVRTAMAKGLSRPRVVLAHAARNALLPIVTVLGLSLPLIVSGAIVTEHIFAWPGMGALAVESIHKLDAPTIIGVVVVTSLAVQAGNLLADIAVAALDPRVRLGGDRSR
jgi:peptide/nickel transport system permease protein